MLLLSNNVWAGCIYQHPLELVGAEIIYSVHWCTS
jgi:hypothetical protein